GEYILLIDSDDYIEPDLVTLVCSNMIEKQALMGVFDYYLTKQDGTKKKKIIYKNNSEYVLGKQAAWARVYHKSLFKHSLFPEGINYEDLAIVPFLLAKSENKLIYINKPLYNYIVDNSGSIMNTYNKKIFDIYLALENLFSLFKQAGIYEQYQEELHYLALEHLCVGHGYRLLRYPDKTRQDFKDIAEFMHINFGPQWQKNKFIKQKIQKQNITSVLALVVPLYLKFFKVIFSDKRGSKK
ncbi:MAG: glycosyltransferase family 2 protein, partial [Culicoidibacterales bacterium]